MQLVKHGISTETTGNFSVEWCIFILSRAAYYLKELDLHTERIYKNKTRKNLRKEKKKKQQIHWEHKELAF